MISIIFMFDVVNWQSGTVANSSISPSRAVIGRVLDAIPVSTAAKPIAISSSSVSPQINSNTLQKILFDQKGLKVFIDIKKQVDGTRVECHFSNMNNALISQLAFQVAIPSVLFDFPHVFIDSILI